MLCCRISTFCCSAADCASLRLHIEADNDRLRCRGRGHIAFRDGADARVQDAHPHLIGRKLLQRIGQHFRRAAHVGFDDQVEILKIAFLELLRQRIERRHARALRHGRFAGLRFAVVTICLAFAVSVTTWNVSPTSGRSSNPTTSAGIDGSASLSRLRRDRQTWRALCRSSAPQIK